MIQMKTGDYEIYQSSSDSRLLDLILSGDAGASFYLIRVKYQKELHGVIYNYFKKINIKFSNGNDLEYWLYKFQNYMDSPTKIEGKNQFDSVKHRDNIHNWLCCCCRYFLFNYKMLEVSVPDDMLKTFCSDVYSMDREPKIYDCNMLEIKMADYFYDFLDIRDTYIMYSYLYCIKKRLVIVHLDEKIADVLIRCGYSGMSAEYVRKIKNKSISKANKFFSKKRENFRRHFSPYNVDNKNSSCEEILLKRRNAIMLELGIYGDFLQMR